MDPISNIVITTSSKESGQLALEMVQRNVADDPITRFVTAEFGELGVVIVAVPATTLQVPIPVVGLFPAKLVVVTLHKPWSGPALAAVGNASMVIVTSSDEDAHAPLLIVHLNVAVVPGTNPVTPDVSEDGVVIVAMPLTTVHTPLPTVAIFPASVAVVVLHNV
jgi:hypothetical protein